MTLQAYAQRHRSGGPFSRLAMVSAIILAWVCSRVPMLNLGYGTDADAWRVAYQAYLMHAKGGYRWSRPPGYPLFELLVSWLAPGGWLITNSVVAAVGLCGALLLWRILIDIASASPAAATLLTLGYIFTPVVWISSTTTMDYVFAETCILAAWYFLGTGRSAIAAVCIGIAVGFRPTSALFFAGLLGMFWFQSAEPLARRARKTTAYCLLWLVVAVIAYAPVLVTYGWNVAPDLGGRPTVAIMIYHLLEVFGVIGWAVFGSFLALFGYIAITRRIQSKQVKPADMMAAVGLGLNLVLFAYFPDESA